jgi:hypothetical protein
MNGFNRRDFVFVSSGAALGNMVVPGVATAADGQTDGLDFSNSGLVTGQPKPGPGTARGRPLSIFDAACAVFLRNLFLRNLFLRNLFLRR